MFPRGDDCFNETILTECQQLFSSKFSFQAYPHDRRLRLAWAGELTSPSPLTLSLHLTLLHGECASISCEGGIPSLCRNHKRDSVWLNVGRPHNFYKCTPNHYYCASATIGDCCSICTETIFLPDLPPSSHATQDSQPLWSESLTALAALLIIVIALAAIFVKFISGSTRTMRSYNEVHSPKSQHIAFPPPIKSVNVTMKIQAIVVYIKEDGNLFDNDINSLQSFLWNRRIHVKDIYNEEECIAESIKIWVQKIMRDNDTKIVLIETELLRSFLNASQARFERARLIEKAVIFLLSSIPLVNQYNKIFLVRLQEAEGMKRAEGDGPSETVLCPGNGRIYFYPQNKDRLAQDLLGFKTHYVKIDT